MLGYYTASGTHVGQHTVTVQMFTFVHLNCVRWHVNPTDFHKRSTPKHRNSRKVRDFWVLEQWNRLFPAGRCFVSSTYLMNVTHGRMSTPGV
jgi:hypothetical protein